MKLSVKKSRNGLIQSVVALLIVLLTAGFQQVWAQEIIVDNDDGAPVYSEQGTWNTGSSAGYGGTYRVANAGTDSSATWVATLPSVEDYTVSVLYRAGSNRASSVHFLLETPAGDESLFVNQQNDDSTWVELGTWAFPAGETTVTLDAKGSSGGTIVVADAIRFAPYTDPTPTPTPTAVPTIEEFRGAWVTAWGDGFKTPSQVENLVENLRTHHYNAILMQARKRGDAYYFPTAPNLEPRAGDIASDFDPLQELIDQAHLHGIEVHAWIVVNNISMEDNESYDPNHVVHTHPELLTKNNDGETLIAEGYYLDPGNPAANQWNYRVVMDLVSNYDIDGIHFDYIRYPSKHAGYNAVAIERFMNEFPVPGINLPPSSADPEFSDWRRRQITDWLRATYVDVMAVKPEMKFTVAVFSNHDNAHDSVYQDWPQWMDEQIIDAYSPMNYTDNNQLFQAQSIFANDRKNGRHCYMGQCGYRNTLANSAQQIADLRTIGCEGNVLFSYQATNNEGVPDSEYFDAMKEQVYSESAAVPVMPWKVNPTGGYIRGRVKNETSGEIIYNATVTVVEPNLSIRSDSEGKYAFVYVDEGLYTIRAEAVGFLSQEVSASTVTAGEVLTLDFMLEPDPAPTPTPTPTPVLVTEIIVDNDDGPPAYYESGSWAASESTGYDDGTYNYAASGTQSIALWRAWLQSGLYEISVIYRTSANRTTSARYTIQTMDGEKSVPVDQTQNNLTWVSLGEFPLVQGENGLYLHAADSEGTETVTISDAVWFRKVGDIPLEANRNGWKLK